MRRDEESWPEFDPGEDDGSLIGFLAVTAMTFMAGLLCGLWLAG